MHDEEYANAVGTISNCYYHDTIDSTNIRAKQLAASGAPEYTCVFAEEQTQGRGRMQRKWISTAGRGIYMTMLLRPAGVSAEASPHYAMAASLAVVSMLGSYGIDSVIKWPNDVLINGRKICGIMSEAAIDTDGKIKHITVGIGINIYGASIEGVPWAGSVESASGVIIPDRGTAAVRLVSELKKVYGELQTSGMEHILAGISKRMITLGKRIRAELDGEAQTGVAVRLMDDLSLLMLTDDGHEMPLNYGEVSVRGLMGYTDD